MSNSRDIVLDQALSLNKRSRRIIPIGVKVTPEFDITLRNLAKKNGLLLTEMLEKLLEVYLAQEEKNKAESKKDKASSKNKETKTKLVKTLKEQN